MLFGGSEIEVWATDAEGQQSNKRFKANWEQPTQVKKETVPMRHASLDLNSGDKDED